MNDLLYVGKFFLQVNMESIFLMAGIYNIVMTLLQRIPSFDHQWASLVAQLEKNLPAMQKTWVQSLGWEDPPEKGRPTHSSILAWRIPRTVSP